MARSFYIVFDRATGLILRNWSGPAVLLPEASEDGTGMVVLTSGGMPKGNWKLDRRKVRKSVTVVESIDQVAELLPATAPDLEAMVDGSRYAAARRVDAAAEALRLNYITPGNGQAMAYAQKRAEAEAVAANPEISPSEAPHIAAEAELNGVGLLDMAAVILTTAHHWTVVSAEIERTRLAAKAAIMAALSVEDIEAAETAFQGSIS